MDEEILPVTEDELRYTSPRIENSSSHGLRDLFDSVYFGGLGAIGIGGVIYGIDGLRSFYHENKPSFEHEILEFISSPSRVLVTLATGAALGYWNFVKRRRSREN